MPINQNRRRKHEEEDDQEWDDLYLLVRTVLNNNIIVLEEELEDLTTAEGSDHRLRPRSRGQFQHQEALQCIKRDYLGIPGDSLTPVFDDKQFDVMFRISRQRFQRLMEDIAGSGSPFYINRRNCYGAFGASLEVKLLLPLKTMAYGVAPHTFRDYFQMSATLARECCLQFNFAIKTIYQEEYLRLPTARDLISINNLHYATHGVNGMFGSLDCMHTIWKNCPVAWQGSFKGKEEKPSIVLEAIADYNLWFWHAAYGFAGTLNDLNVLNLSPFLESLVNGDFQKVESTVVPFEIAGQEFNKFFVLVDGIYPRYARFVKGMSEPVSDQEKQFTAWQEAARKDIERAFGVLQSKWQCLRRPMHAMQQDILADQVAACIILHNMCVSDRVMEGDVAACYDPSKAVGNEMAEVLAYPEDIGGVQQANIGIGNGAAVNAELMTRQDRWEALQDMLEHTRLHEALMAATAQVHHE